MCDKSEGTHNQNSARKYEDDEMEPQLPARQDSDSVDDEADRMEDNGGAAQRSTPSSPADSFRAPKGLIYFEQDAQPLDSSTDGQPHTSIHRRMPPLILPETQKFARRYPTDRSHSELNGSKINESFAVFTRIQESLGCSMPGWPERCVKDRMGMESTRRRPLFPRTPPAHAADRPQQQQQQQQHQPQPRARNTDAGPEPEAGGAVDSAGAPRNERGEEVGHARARRHAIHVVQQQVGGGCQTRQQAMAGKGQQQTAAAHSQQPVNQAQHSHNHTSSPAEDGRVGEVKGVVDPRISSSEREGDYH